MGEHSVETGCFSPNSWRSARAEEEMGGGVVTGDEVNRKFHPPVNLETPLDPKYIASAKCIIGSVKGKS